MNGNEKKFRCLYPEEVKVRVNNVYKDGASLIIYNDSSACLSVLDERYPGNWEDEYIRKDGTLFCRLTLHTENGPRTFEDCGVKSDIDPEKGEVADAFKRACRKAGVARAILTAPKIYVSADALGVPPYKEEVADAIKKAKPFVSDISFATGRSGEYIDFIEINSETNGQILFSWSSGRDSSIPAEPVKAAAPTKAPEKKEDVKDAPVNEAPTPLQILKELMEKLPGCTEEYLCGKMKTNTLQEIADSKDLFGICVERLNEQIAKRAKKAEAPAPEAPKPAPEEKPAESAFPTPIDPLDLYTGAGDDEQEAKTVNPEDVIFDCTDDVPEDVLALRGTRIGDLSEEFIKSFARKNAKIRVCIYDDVLKAIEEVKSKK